MILKNVEFGIWPGLTKPTLVGQWPYSLSSLVENKKLDMKPKFELPTPWGVEVRRP